LLSLRRHGMGKINLGRVVLGGLLSGLVLNIGEYLLNDLIFGKRWEEVLKSLNRNPMDTKGMALFIILLFALGVFTVWVYAAIRPRFGSGPMTAVCAGLVVWFLVSLYASASSLPMHLFPRRLLLYSAIWQFFEMPIAAVVGAWAYKEEA
jgi:hypothetical protein